MQSIRATFVRNIVTKTFELAQSGHTVCYAETDR